MTSPVTDGFFTQYGAFMDKCYIPAVKKEFNEAHLYSKVAIAAVWFLGMAKVSFALTNGFFLVAIAAHNYYHYNAHINGSFDANHIVRVANSVFDKIKVSLS